MDKAKARAASMPNPFGFLQRTVNQDRADGQATSARSATFSQRPRDPNSTDSRLLLNQKCIYERQLPGNSYITAHIARLQRGYYDSPVVHGDRVENCRFIAINFVFHPVNTTHRFISAKISLSLQDKEAIPQGGLPLPPQIDHPNNARPSFSKVTTRQKPRFLRHAPHLLYGSLSPETLDWTFNLAGSLGVSQGPANASINPSGGVKSSYKVYKMMKIQGSVRTLNSWHGHEFDVEDGSLVWTLEENELQKSGLPREFTFVVLITKGDAPEVIFDIDIEPVVGSWYGTYPKWWIDRIWYRPMHKEDIDIDFERGQRFGPATKKEGFNFASLMGTFDDFVTMPGTMYSRSENPGSGTMIMDDTHRGAAQPTMPSRQISASPAPQIPQDLNIRVFLEGYNKHSPLGGPKNGASNAKANSPTQRSGLVISRSRNNSRNRPRSEHYPTPSPPDSPSLKKARPVSAIYEVSSADFDDDGPDNGREQQQRPLSAVTDISDDLFHPPLSPIKGLRISKSLRHSRSRPDLQDAYDASAPIPAQSQAREGQESAITLMPKSAPQAHSYPNRSVRANDQPEKELMRRPQNQQSQTEPKLLPRYPHRAGAQPMRRTSNTQQPTSHHTPSKLSISTDPAVLRVQNPNVPSSSSITSSQKRLTPRQVRNSAYINPVDLNHARFKLAQDSPTLPLPPQPPSFPPTSYPNFAPTTTTSLNSNPPAPASSSNLPPLAPIPPVAPVPPHLDTTLHGLGVDTLVQQEVTNYLKAHPELYSPQSSLLNVGINNDAKASHHQDTALDTRPATATDTTDPSTFTHHNFSMPNHIRPSTATSAGNEKNYTHGHTSSTAGPSSGGGGGGGGSSSGLGAGSGNRDGKHRRSQSLQQAPRYWTSNGEVGEKLNYANDYDAAHSPVRSIDNRGERSRSRERNASQGGANGEFIRVSTGGLGHGGWEYLE